MPKTQHATERRTEATPYQYGYRYLRVVRPDGTEGTDIVPLREEDLLHPQEGDFIVQNDYHISDVLYLIAVFRAQTASLPGIRVFGDHIIDFQHGGVQPLGPDVTVLNGETLKWDRGRATFPVGDMKARVLFAIEVTSPSTRKKDLGPKLDLYYRAGVPLYVIVDAEYGGGKKPVGVMAHQAGPEFYEPLDVNDNGRFWLDIVNVWIGIEDGHVACYDQDGSRISAPEEAIRDLKHERARAEQERARAEQEKARAETAEARVRELEAKIKKTNRRKK
jgi:Uma2 family endonuclease